MFEIQVVSDDLVRFVGRLDASRADDATENLKAFASSLTADCTDLDYISSAGIGVILATHQRLSGAGHTLRLINMNPRVRMVLTYTGLDRMLHIE